ncbi:MAG: DEAD/DEAH box helicase family protein [Nanoarchaeota archaeon]|nr:DEAD/DEAH box helicase family protein [Nanoarchaeota archaeon]
MEYSSNEATARLKINSLLEKAGWRLFDIGNKRANVIVEDRVSLEKIDFNELGVDYEKTSNGFIDYLLVDEQRNPLLILEAKRESINPLSAQNQAREYAKSKNCKYIILSNGNIHYLWNLETDNKEAISEFPSLEDIVKKRNFDEEFEKGRSKLLNYPFDRYLIAESQIEGLVQNPKYQDNKELYCKTNKLIALRDFQFEALEKMRESIQNGKDRFLFEMATGTGKTLVAASVIKMFLKSGFTNRVLFLVDRIDLEKQALSDFKEYFEGDKVVNIGIYKEHKQDWHNCNILITTIQSLVKENRFEKFFGRYDFGLIITDEAHRSISGATNRELFKYFKSYKLGLTATPKAFLKNIDETKMLLNKPLELEERRARDTYSIFGCETGEATFVYDLKRGIEDNILNKAQLVDSKTIITTELLSEKGLEVKTIDEDGNELTDTYFMKHFEKKFFSTRTNKEVCKHFLETAQRDPITGEIGKTIFFCVSQEHALKVTNMLNKLAQEMYDYPVGYDIAKRITSDEEQANLDSKLFNHKHNKLGGYSRVNEKYVNYHTSKVRIAVTVSMMSTGYNCCDLLNIVMFRPIYSPAEFIQIKGRGTRLFTFSWKNEDGYNLSNTVKKDKYYLFDYFGICDYFEKKYDFKKPEKIAKVNNGVSESGGEEYDLFNSNEQDKIITSFKKEIGAEGFIVDRQGLRESVDRDNTNIKDLIIQLYEEGRVDEAQKKIEEFFKEKSLNYDILRHFFSLNREISIDDIYSFLKFDSVKDDSQYFNEKFDEFFSKYSFDKDLKDDLKIFFQEYCYNPKVRSCIDRDELSKIADFEFLKVYGKIKEYKEEIIDYIYDNNLYL